MLTKEDFIKESLKIHGNKYIYDKCVIKRKIDKKELEMWFNYCAEKRFFDES